MKYRVVVDLLKQLGCEGCCEELGHSSRLEKMILDSRVLLGGLFFSYLQMALVCQELHTF